MAHTVPVTVVLESLAQLKFFIFAMGVVRSFKCRGAVLIELMKSLPIEPAFGLGALGGGGGGGASALWQ
jgi:hypothetical protein